MSRIKAAHASQSRCQLHRKRESQRHVSGCETSRNRRPSARLSVPQPTKWQRIGNQIDAAMIFTRADYLNVRTVPVMGRLWDCDDLGQGVIPVLT